MSSDRKPDGSEPIAQDETVFRRVLTHHYVKASDILFPQAFEPRKSDKTGISLCRANYLPEPKAEAAASMAPEGMEFWVVELHAEDLRKAGLTVTPKPTAKFVGHAEIAVLNSEGIGSNRTIELMSAASVLPRKVHGPFPGREPRRRSSSYAHCT